MPPIDDHGDARASSAVRSTPSLTRSFVARRWSWPPALSARLRRRRVVGGARRVHRCLELARRGQPSRRRRTPRPPRSSTSASSSLMTRNSPRSTSPVRSSRGGLPAGRRRFELGRRSRPIRARRRRGRRRAASSSAETQTFSGHGDDRLADAEVDVEVDDGVVRPVEVAQVDDELADAELVAVRGQRRDGERRVLALADAVAEARCRRPRRRPSGTARATAGTISQRAPAAERGEGEQRLRSRSRPRRRRRRGRWPPAQALATASAPSAPMAKHGEHDAGSDRRDAVRGAPARPTPRRTRRLARSTEDANAASRSRQATKIQPSRRRRTRRRRSPRRGR